VSTKIQWTDETWNPTTGCTKISPGCAHCYIERTPAFRIAGRKFDAKAHIPLQLHADRLEQPLHWRKARRIFVNSLSDLFHDDVPDTFIDRVFSVMGLSGHHTFQILTKRAARMRQYMTSRPASPTVPGEINIVTESGLSVYHVRWPLPNVWLGVSVENQHFADERIPLLLQTPAAVRFISAEPLLGPIDLAGMEFWGPLDRARLHRGLGWVICGGESGPGARPCAVEWLEAIVQQCQAAGVPVFVKQLGAYVVSELRTMPAGDIFDPAKLKLEHFCTQYPDEVWAWRAGLRDRKGGDIAEFPAALRVREFPA
jgi:protein gp37